MEGLKVPSDGPITFVTPEVCPIANKSLDGTALMKFTDLIQPTISAVLTSCQVVHPPGRMQIQD